MFEYILVAGVCGSGQAEINVDTPVASCGCGIMAPGGVQAAGDRWVFAVVSWRFEDVWAVAD